MVIFPISRSLHISFYPPYELMPEMKVLFPYIKEVSCAHTYLMDMDSIKPDTVLLVYLKSKEKVREAEQEKIKKWLAARVEQKKIKLIIE